MKWQALRERNIVHWKIECSAQATFHRKVLSLRLQILLVNNNNVIVGVSHTIPLA